MPTPKTRKKKLTIKDIVEAAHAAGAKVDFKLEPKLKLPTRLPKDPEPVRLLLDESERCNAAGNEWLNAEHPNYIAAETWLRNGWAYALAGAWLRCKLNGELQPEIEKRKAE